MLKVHHLNCATLCPSGGRLINGKGSIFSRAKMVCHCLLIETDNGLVLVDTGLGMLDIVLASRINASFKMLAGPVLLKEETAVSQVKALGFSPDDVRHIVPTHLDIDHAGGFADFPKAVIHIFKDEYDAAMQPKTLREKYRYNNKYWEHNPDWEIYKLAGESWYDFACVRELKSLPDIILVPLMGHTRGHCGVAVNTPDGWLLHAGDAYFFHGEIAQDQHKCPLGLEILQKLDQVEAAKRINNQNRLRKLVKEHSKEITIFCAHDPVEFDRLALGL